MDLEESMCRFCTGTEEVLYDIFDETNDVLNKCLMYLHIKIDRKIGLPTSICIDCYSILTGFDEFYEKAHEINQMLKRKSLVNVFKRKKEVIVRKEVQENLKAEPFEQISVNQIAPMDNEEEETVALEGVGESNSYNSDTLDEANNLDQDEDPDYEPVQENARPSAKKRKQNYSDLDSRPFWCETCDATFPNNSALKRHKNIHSRTRLYQCPMCDHKSTEMYNLKQHLYKHNTGKSYICEICDRRFKNPMSIRGHVKSNHPSHANKYECKRCSKKFHTQQLLTEHNQEIHQKSMEESAKDTSSEIKIKCRLCDEKGSPQPTRITHDYAFKLHLKKMHRIEDANYLQYVLNNE